MIVNTSVKSPYLGQADVREPIIAVMDDVTEVAHLRNHQVLHFIDRRIKPLPLNHTNLQAIVAIYGTDTEAWEGKPIEIYVDPTVTDSRGRVTGGVRVRIPTNI